jgi:hypothetical protein
LARPIQACDTSSCSLVSRGQNGLVAKGDFRVDLSYRHTDESIGLVGGRSSQEIRRPKVALEQGALWPGFHREIGGRDAFLQLDLAYGLAAGTTVLASVPLIADRSYTVAHVGIPEQRYGTRGPGDALLGVRQTLVKGLVGGLSVKLPTARYRTVGDVGGTILDPTLQPGSGSWDVAGSLQHGGRIARWAVDWSIAGSHQVNTENSLGYRFGNLTLAALSGSRRVAGPLGVSLQMKFVHEARHEFRGERVPSSGSRFLYVAPGFRLGLPDRAALYGLVQLLPYRHVNETQLAPRSSLLLGIQKTF